MTYFFQHVNSWFIFFLTKISEWACFYCSILILCLCNIMKYFSNSRRWVFCFQAAQVSMNNVMQNDAEYIMQVAALSSSLHVSSSSERFSQPNLCERTKIASIIYGDHICTFLSRCDYVGWKELRKNRIFRKGRGKGQ